MRSHLLASVVLLAFATVSAAAAPIFSDTTPGLASVTLAPGTYDIVATGAGGGPSSIDIAGGLGGVVEGPSPSPRPRR